MKLILVRHATAEDHAGTDFERRLIAKGREQSKVVGGFFERLSLAPDRIISSPYLRARETADIIAAQMSNAPEVEEDGRLGCGMRPDDAMDILKEWDNEGIVVMVGHQPDFGRLVSYLTRAADGGSYAFKKTASAFLDLYNYNFGGGVLEAFVPVKMLK